MVVRNLNKRATAREFFSTFAQQRQLISSMVWREVKSKYVGSTLGIVWTFIPPLVLIFVFWVVFSVGFRAVPKNDIPFVVWLTAGMTSWFAFSEMVSGATFSITGNSNLIKKTIFPSQVLPVIKIFSALVTHGCFLFILIVLIILNSLPVSWYYLQVIYYLLCLLILSAGFCWLFAALHVFVRDVGQLVGLILQVGFWATPIFWDIAMMPEKVQYLLKLNPMFYIVEGYRETFIYFVPFWQHPYLTAYFWSFALGIFCLGSYVFNRLKPQFADVL